MIEIRDASDEQMNRIYTARREEFRVWVAPGYWFRMPLNQMRIGFSWEEAETTARSLGLISAALDKYLG